MTLPDFWLLVDLGGGLDACWPWLGQLDKDGYGVYGRHRAHRFAFECGHRARLPPEVVVRHTCDNRRCCNLGHLVSGSQLENVADRVERDRSAKGHRNGRAALTEAQALAVLDAQGSYSEIAATFGISKWSVRDIKTGRNWGWLTGLNSNGRNVGTGTFQTSGTFPA